MRILVFSIIDPVTFRGGAGTATRGMLRLLTEEPIEAKIEVLPSIPAGGRFGHRIRQARSVFHSFISVLPSKAIYQRAGGYPAIVRRRLAQRDYDLVLINGCDLAWATNDIPEDVPVIVWAHNLEHQLYERQLDTLPAPWFLRRVLAADLTKLRSFETEALSRAEGLMFLSSTEAARMRRYLTRHPPLVVPPLFHGNPEARRPRKRRFRIEVGFLANFNWWPNLDGLRWFLDEIFPHCRGRIRLHLFGSGSERSSGRAVGVSTHGYVEHLSTVWQTCDVMVCPIRAGGGVNVKLTEALFHGVPVLATPHAVKGLSLDPDDALAVVEDAQDWIGFMLGDALDALAAAKVSRKNREMFAADAHRKRIADYLANIIHDCA